MSVITKVLVMLFSATEPTASAYGKKFLKLYVENVLVMPYIELKFCYYVVFHVYRIVLLNWWVPKVGHNIFKIGSWTAGGGGVAKCK